MTTLQLRNYQNDAIEELRKGFAKGYRVQMLAAPTGAGKTEMAIALLNATKIKGNKSAMILDRIVLCDQTSQRLDKYKIDHGVMQSGHWRYRPYEYIQVCSAQTLERRGSFPGLNLLIVDEAHQTRQQTMEFIKNNPDVRAIGLSATPFTKGLGRIFENVVSTVTTKQLVEDKVLVPLKVFIAKEIDMSGAKKIAGEWSQQETTERGMKITGDIVTEWIKKTHEIFGKPVKTIVFCSGVEHGADLSKKFAEQGYNFISISYKDDDEFKKEAIKDFAKPDTEINGLIATDILTKGFDVSDVMIGVSARPFSKSLSSHIQQMGRVMRPHPDKEFSVWLDHCIATGQKVLTHRGLVPIELILITDKIWDGHEFVSHKGVVSRGKRPVIKYAGLTATPDHLVKTRDEGWCSFGYCAEKQKPIITTGIGGSKIRECDDYFTSSDMAWSETSQIHARSLRVRSLWLSFDNFINKFTKWKNKGMQAMQSTQASSSVAQCKSGSNTGEMQESEQFKLRKLWWKGDRVQIRLSDFLRSLDSRELGIIGHAQGTRFGQDRQQWSLRAWESKICTEINKQQQSQNIEVDSINAQVQNGKPANKLCGFNFASIIKRWFNFSRDSRKISSTFTETEREVWDILDCGPRNSFTCEGLLVHNSGNYLRFREDWEDVFENGVSELDDGKEKVKKEPSDKEKKDSKCPVCSALWKGFTDVCYNCGHVRERKNKVTSVAGEMEELESMSSVSKQDFWSQLQFQVKYHGWSTGRAAHTFKDKFGVWPRGLDDTIVMTPTNDTVNFIRKRVKAYISSIRRPR